MQFEQEIIDICQSLSFALIWGIIQRELETIFGHYLFFDYI